MRGGSDLLLIPQKASKVKLIPTTINTTRLSQTVAPEDLRVGDYLGVLQASVQYPTYLWHGDLSADVSDEESVRVSYMPTDGGIPLKIKAISLPFLLVKPPGQNCETIDIRLCRIARLDADYAKLAWKELGKPFVKAKRRTTKRSKRKAK